MIYMLRLIFLQQSNNIYSIIFFPIYIGYWTLLEIDINECIVHYYNLGNTEMYTESILVSCYTFLQQECFYFNSVNRDLNMIKTLRYEKKNFSTDIIEDDSAAFILMIISRTVLPKLKSTDESDPDKHATEDYKQSQVQDFKEDLARMLYEHNDISN